MRMFRYDSLNNPGSDRRLSRLSRVSCVFHFTIYFTLYFTTGNKVL